MNYDIIHVEESELDRCGDAIRLALQADDEAVKVTHLNKVREIFATSTQLDDLLDSYLDEIIDFIAIPSMDMRICIVNFLEQICRQDCNVMAKAIPKYVGLLNEETHAAVIKAIIRACIRLYPILLQRSIERGYDHEVQKCWEAFAIAKNRVMTYIEDDNEGIKTMALKFLECVVLCQSVKPEVIVSNGNGNGNNGMQMCLNEIPSDHRFVSYKQMQQEGIHSLQAILDQMNLPHISSQNLIAALGCVINIARQRPDHLQKVLDAIEILHVNLPPTLGQTQVKSVRKELKMHLLRLLRVPAIIGAYQRVSTLLVDLGASPSEINRATGPEILEQLKKRKRAAEEEQNKDDAVKRRREMPDVQGPSTSREPPKLLDDEDYEESEARPDEKPAHQTAIDITSQYVFERLNPKIVANLVIISLYTLPDTMPAAFQSSYTPIAIAGTEEQRRHLSRMIATQATAAELGPGVEYMRVEKKRQFDERQNLRSSGAAIPPTPAHGLVQPSDKPKTPAKPAKPQFVEPALPVQAPTIQEFDIVKDCKPMRRSEAVTLFEMAFRGVMDAEIVARKSNMFSIHNKLLVRLATRFHFEEKEMDFTELMVDFIVAEHKARADLAVLWISELYAQYQGYSICYAHRKGGQFTKAERLQSYDRTLTALAEAMFNKGLHQEMAFHRLFLEAPLVTPNSLRSLKNACLDELYGPFCLTTLREMIIARSRQRSELIDLLFQLGHYEGTETSQQAVAIGKELYELDYVKGDVTQHLISQLDACLVDPPPEYFARPGLPTPTHWTDALYRSALHMYLDMLPVDPSLIHRLAVVYSKSPNTFKKVTLWMIETPIRSIGMRSPEIVKLVQTCPRGSETLIARIIHVLSERTSVTPEIVVGMKKLHEERHTDVRSLIPVLSGLSRADVDKLLPQLLLDPNNQKSVQHVFKRVLQGKHPETNEPPMDPIEFIVCYHHLVPNGPEQTRLHGANLEILYTNRMMSRDVVSTAVERLMDDRPLCDLFFPTLVWIHQKWPTLDGFLSNILLKVVNRELWKEKPEQEQSFFEALDKLGTVSYVVVLTGFNSEEFKKYLSMSANKTDLLSRLRDFLPQLSTHQQKQMSTTILEMVKASDRDRDKENRRERKHR